MNETMLCSPRGCDKTSPGHGVRPLQVRVAAATPSKWRDGVVTHLPASGWIGIGLMESDRTIWVWNHADLSSEVTLGTPVAVHALYDMLALGSDRVHVLVAPALPGVDGA
ncbi:hypothetical protein D9V28_08835 [Mycetocola zhadangensis]|uniref:Uncharacterized protein n=1 Tax=Mycetocola zhadangensis TaxID=1164595 RepID=A0A3L7J1M2_9MICO|nr:hypothetical protein D9V28_08835 [Mycetocola zhadangensis]